MLPPIRSCWVRLSTLVYVALLVVAPVSSLAQFFGPGPEGTKPEPVFKRPFGEPKASAQENFTDPDSRIMTRGSSGFEQCYKAQIAVDETERIIVATHVTQSAGDVCEK